MAQEVEELIQILGEEKSWEERLLEVLRAKKQLVVKGQVEELSELLKKEELVLGKIRLITMRRRKVVAEIRKRYRVTNVALTVEEVIRLVDEPHRSRLSAMRKELKRIMRELHYLNDLIKTLIKQSLQHLNLLVEAITTAGGHCPVYSCRGRQEKVGNVGLVLLDQVA